MVDDFSCHPFNNCLQPNRKTVFDVFRCGFVRKFLKAPEQYIYPGLGVAYENKKNNNYANRNAFIPYSNMVSY